MGVCDTVHTVLGLGWRKGDPTPGVNWTVSVGLLKLPLSPFSSEVVVYGHWL